MTTSITLSTGVTLPYVEHGDPDGVPVILLHGYSDSWRSWELLLARLPEELRAFALTQRGHGDAERPDSGYSPEQHAADVAAFMDAMGIDSAVIAGHSGGSYAAQRFVVEHPERTRGLVLIGAFRSFHDKPEVRGLHEAVMAFTDPVDPAFVREFQESCVAQPIPDGYLDGIIAESLKLPARVWQRYLSDHLAADVPTESGTIAAPTLILWGDQDAFCPRGDQEALVAAIPRARLVTYAGTGHTPHWEQPARTAADITRFVARIEDAAPAAAR